MRGDRILVIYIASTTLLISLTGFCGAQAKQDPETSKLARKVRLLLGPTTVGKAISAIAEQSGLRIEAAEYLLGHKLTVQMEGITAKEALDALATLNDWKLTKAEDGSYALARPTARPVQRASDSGRALRATLPKEFRVYLGIDPPIDEPQDRAPNGMRIAAANGLCRRAQQKLLETVQPDLSKALDIPYAKLTLEQNDNLLVSLVFRIFHGMTDMDLWTDGRGFHRMEPANVYLELAQREILMVSAKDNEGGFPAFGQNIFRGPGSLGDKNPQ